MILQPLSKLNEKTNQATSLFKGQLRYVVLVIGYQLSVMLIAES